MATPLDPELRKALLKLTASLNELTALLETPPDVTKVAGVDDGAAPVREDDAIAAASASEPTPEPSIRDLFRERVPTAARLSALEEELRQWGFPGGYVGGGAWPPPSMMEWADILDRDPDPDRRKYKNPAAHPPWCEVGFGSLREESNDGFEFIWNHHRPVTLYGVAHNRDAKGYPTQTTVLMYVRGFTRHVVRYLTDLTL